MYMYVDCQTFFVIIHEKVSVTDAFSAQLQFTDTQETYANYVVVIIIGVQMDNGCCGGNEAQSK